MVEIEATQAGEPIGAVDPHVDEWVFEDDLPVDVGFAIAFDEPVTLPSAREGVWIEDPEGVELAVNVTARLDAIEIAPRAPLGAAQNHVLVLSTRIRDNWTPRCSTRTGSRSSPRSERRPQRWCAGRGGTGPLRPVFGLSR